MTPTNQTESGPLVTVLVATFNRPKYLSKALASVLRQTHKNLQIVVVNDGGCDVTDIVKSFNDPRLLLINRNENRGKAFSLNEALSYVRGKYIAYLDDDDLYYPNHIETLVDALENKTQCGVAYTDLYKVYCKVMPNSERTVLSNVVEVSRDFDRFLVLYFNHVLHVSLMHRTDLLRKPGPYNENLDILIDWDITRRLAFFSDFYHVAEVTGEYYHPAEQSDRISFQQRRDSDKYLKNALMIRTARPAKPWPKIKDMSIIFNTDRMDKSAAETLGSIWRFSFYPYKLYLPLDKANVNNLNITMPNIVPVVVDTFASENQRIDKALAQCDGYYVTIVPSSFDIGEMWLEDSLYALINSLHTNEAFELESSTDALWAVVAKRDDLLRARRAFPMLPVRQAISAAGISLKRITPTQIPFQFDQLLEEARRVGENGDHVQAAKIFEYIGCHYENRLWMNALTADALYRAQDHDKAAEIAAELNRGRPTVDTLLLEARLHQERNNFDHAIQLLDRAKNILEGKALVWI